MRRRHPRLERLQIEGLRCAAVFALDQRCTQRIQLPRALLFAANQIADAFAVVGVMPRLNLGLDPAVLLVGEGDGFAHGGHDGLQVEGNESYYWCENASKMPLGVRGDGVMGNTVELCTQSVGWADEGSPTFLRINNMLGFLASAQPTYQKLDSTVLRVMGERNWELVT